MSGSWIILGASSALAQAFAHQIAQENCSILLAGRNTRELDATAADLAIRYNNYNISTILFDTQRADCYSALQQHAIQLPKPINIYVAIGSMPDQQIMLAQTDVCAEMVLSTYTGIVLAINSLVPLFQEQMGGSIVVLGSVAGDRGRKKNFLYGSAKAGLEAYCQGLRALLSTAKIKVLLVKPGVMDTPMTWGLKNPPLPIGDPETLAKACVRKAKKGGVLYFPRFWKYIMLIIRHLPTAIFNRLNF